MSGGKHNRDALKDALMSSIDSDRLLRRAESALTNLLTGIPELEMSASQKSAIETLGDIKTYLRPTSPKN